MSFAVEIGADIGGTFTDLVAVRGGMVFVHKLPTTPSDPAQAVLAGTEALLAKCGADGSAVTRFVHASTIATNAVLQRRGARTALITTEGFRDVLEIGRERRFDVYDLSIDRPAPVVPRQLRFEVTERCAPDGSVLTKLDERAATEVATRLLADGVEAVAVSFLHSFQNAAHEERMRDILLDRSPLWTVSISSEVAPEMGEYERTSTVALDAYVKPLVRGYLKRLEAGLRDIGVAVQLSVMQSNGGFVSSSVAREAPIRLLESGPAAGVVFAGVEAEAVLPKLVAAFDMGGTTAKTCYMDGSEPRYSRSFEVARAHRFKRNSGLPVRTSAVDLVEIGAGGGSIAALTPMGTIRVGPESAGAQPGPACYGRGGTQPTVTDADLLLGYLDPVTFADGKMNLDLAAAETAMQPLAAKVGLPLLETAWMVHETVVDAMAYNARMHAIEKALDLSAYALVAFGGAGPVHAYSLAWRLGVSTLLIPPRAGVASALGLLIARPSAHAVKGSFEDLDELTAERVGDVFLMLEQECRQQLHLASTDAAGQIRRSADLRYAGQSYELEVEVPDSFGNARPADLLCGAFAEAYERHYGRRLDGHPVEVTAWRLEVRGDRGAVVPVSRVAVGESRTDKPRLITDPVSGERVLASVFLRESLHPGDEVKGPALIEEPESTTLVGSGGGLVVDDTWNLRINIGEARRSRGDDYSY